MRRIEYGADACQFGELTLPSGDSRGVVVVIHGGFWKAAYGAGLGRPLATDLADRGWAAWNIEYRRVGNGGGDPETFDDVAAAIDALADLPDFTASDLTTVVALGHSAGGQLAAWAAARGQVQRMPERWSARVPVTHVISQAGVLDLEQAHRDDLGGGAVERFVGSPGPSYDLVDPARQLPLAVPLWCVHARDDEDVPYAQSVDYVARARAAGGSAELVTVDGGHFALIDPATEAWARIVGILDAIA